MTTYIQYSIRCPTCGESVANKVSTYLNLLKAGETPEEALNLMDITDACTRICFLVPSIKKHNAQNQEVVNGTVIAETARLKYVLGSLSDPDSKFEYAESIYPPANIKGKGNVAEVVREFDRPTVLGIPTYNPDPKYPTIHIDLRHEGFTVEVMKGQSYIAG